MKIKSLNADLFLKVRNYLTTVIAGLIITIGMSGCDFLEDFLDEREEGGRFKFPLVQIPKGYMIEKVAEGLDRPTSITWDDDGNMYAVEAGNDFLPEQDTPMRIVKITKDGSRETVVDLQGKGIKPAIVGLIWHDGFFYFTQRAQDATGAVSRADMDGNVQLLFKGIIDSQAEHQINDIGVGPDQMMYISVGPAGNAGVVGPSIAPFVTSAKPM